MVELFVARDSKTARYCVNPTVWGININQMSTYLSGKIERFLQKKILRFPRECYSSQWESTLSFVKF